MPTNYVLDIFKSGKHVLDTSKTKLKLKWILFQSKTLGGAFVIHSLAQVFEYSNKLGGRVNQYSTEYHAQGAVFHEGSCTQVNGNGGGAEVEGGKVKGVSVIFTLAVDSRNPARSAPVRGYTGKIRMYAENLSLWWTIITWCIVLFPVLLLPISAPRLTTLKIFVD